LTAAVHPAVLDTDVASLLHRRKLTGPLAARLTGREPLITFVTYGELTKWAEIRHWGARRREELAGWLSGNRLAAAGHDRSGAPGLAGGGTRGSLPTRRRPRASPM
jgi:hypothetical protein